MMICAAELSRDVVFTAWVAVCDTDDDFCFDEKTFVAGTVVNVHDVFVDYDEVYVVLVINECGLRYWATSVYPVSELLFDGLF